VADPEGVFTVVVPEIEGAREVVLHGSPPAAHRRREAARELARFDLTAHLRGAGGARP